MEYTPIKKEAFHIHTFRCKHASMEADCEYIETAINNGIKRIVFTDHAPFPRNPFKNRMDYEQLPEYINNLRSLEAKYKTFIDVKVGLEIEYLPSYGEYYTRLIKDNKLDLLVLGQHFYEIEPEYYSFNLPKEVLSEKEFKGLSEAIVKGIETRYFQVVAHPERCFQRLKDWNWEAEICGARIVNAAMMNDVYLEKNYASMFRKRQFRTEFWEKVSDRVRTIEGLDAHSVWDMERYWKEAVLRENIRVKDKAKNELADNSPYFLKKASKCAICNNKEKNSHLFLQCKSFSYNLDFRPTDFDENTMVWLLNECSACGYVSEDISDFSYISEECLKSKEYLECEGVKFKNRLATTFYRYYYINLRDNNLEEAFDAIIQAAWLCDDSQDVENAIICRKKAIAVVEQFADIEIYIHEKYFVIKADLLRRTSQFDVLIEEFSNKKFSFELYNRIVQFQLGRAMNKDNGCYNIDILV